MLTKRFVQRYSWKKPKALGLVWRVSMIGVVIGIVLLIGGLASAIYGLTGAGVSPSKQIISSAEKGFADPKTVWLLAGALAILAGIIVFTIGFKIAADKRFRAKNGTAKKRLSVFRKLVIHRQFMYLLAPGVLYLLIFSYLPLPGILIAFKNLMFMKSNFVLSFLDSKWYGIRNFKFFFMSPDAWNVTRNTILYNLVFIILGLIGAVAVAICMTELRNRRTAKLYQTIIIFPAFISWVIVSFLIYSFLNPDFGVVNQVLKSLGMKPVSWYMDPRFWPYLLVFFHLWKGLGMGSIIYIATISGIDQEMFQAAQIDGATKWQQIKHVTLPSLRTTMTLLTIMSLGNIFRSDFGLFWVSTLQLGKGALFTVGHTIDTYVFNALMNKGNYSLSSAVGLYQSTVGFFLIMAANFVVSKVDPDSRLF